jgi:hypothetical protein
MVLLRVGNMALDEIFPLSKDTIMARSKPYTLKLGIFDLFMLLITAGAWIVVMLIRELIRWS